MDQQVCSAFRIEVDYTPSSIRWVRFLIKNRGDYLGRVPCQHQQFRIFLHVNSFHSPILPYHPYYVNSPGLSGVCRQIAPTVVYAPYGYARTPQARGISATLGTHRDAAGEAGATCADADLPPASSTTQSVTRGRRAARRRVLRRYPDSVVG